MILKAKTEYLLKHNILINKIFKALASAVLRFFGLFVTIDESAILFTAHSRKYNDSPKVIYEYLLSRPEYKKFTFYWALDNINIDIPGNAKKIRSDTPKYFYIALKCKYWITCVNIERGLSFKKKECIYLNTWHGIPIKTIGNEAAGRNDYDFSYVDYFCVSGTYEPRVYQRSFNVPVINMIKTGLPRNDTLYSVTAEEVEAIKRKIGLPLDKKLLLYVPTWRDSKDGGKTYRITPPIHLDKWKEKLGCDYVLLFRAHPYTTDLLGVKFDSFILDFTGYSDINDLLKIADVLISDYSATIFDYSILERPIISFAYDFNDYSQERGLIIDIRQELPGGICESEDEVIDRILNIDLGLEKRNVRDFRRKYISYGGNATKLCVEAVFGRKNRFNK